MKARYGYLFEQYHDTSDKRRYIHAVEQAIGYLKKARVIIKLEFRALKLTKLHPAFSVDY